MAIPFDFSDLTSALVPSVQKLPQTQEDIRALARAAKEFQSPEVQARLAAVEMKIESYARSQLILQAISTASMVGVFILALRKKS